MHATVPVLVIATPTLTVLTSPWRPPAIARDPAEHGTSAVGDAATVGLGLTAADGLGDTPPLGPRPASPTSRTIPTRRTAATPNNATRTSAESPARDRR